MHLLKCLSDFPEFKVLTFLEPGFREAALGMPSPVTRERLENSPTKYKEGCWRKWDKKQNLQQ